MAILKEEYIKKFKRCVLEYTGGFDSTIDEAGEDDAMQDMGGDPGMMGGEGMEPNGDPNAMGGEPMQPNGDPNAMEGDPNAMEGDPNMVGGEGGVEGFEPEGANPDAPMDGMGGDPNAMGGDPNMMGGEPMQPGDEVIDVDDLTKSQETAEKKIDKMNHKFEELMGAISNLVKQNAEREKSTVEAIAASEKRMDCSGRYREKGPADRQEAFRCYGCGTLCR